MIYLFVFIILIIGCVLFGANKGKRGRKGWLILEWLLLVLLAGLRYKVGGDTLVYMDRYNDLPPFYQFRYFDFEDSRYNVLWICFVAFCKLISDNYFFMQILHALILNTIIVRFFVKHTENYFLAIALYYFLFYLNFNMEIMRASLSVAIFLLGFDYLQEKKWVKYFFVCLIALGVHSEAIALFLLPIGLILNKISINILNIVSFLFVSVIILIQMNFVPYMSDIGYLTEAQTHSINFYGEKSGILFTVNKLISFVTSLIPILFILWANKDRKEIKLNGYMFILLFCSIQSFKYLILFSRPMDYLKPIYVLALAETLGYIWYKKKKALLGMSQLMVIIITFNVYMELTRNSFFPYWKRYYPYSSIINPEDNLEREYMMHLYYINDD